MSHDADRDSTAQTLDSSSQDDSANRGSVNVDGVSSSRSDGVTVGELYDELQVNGSESTEQGVRLRPEQHSEVLLDRVLTSLSYEPEFGFQESVVKDNLEDVLLLLVSLRSANTNGKSLMGDLTAIFDTHMSPGTIYPQLHDLEEQGLLRSQELVRSKEYLVDDDEQVIERLSASMEQHMVLSMLYKAALEELLQSS